MTKNVKALWKQICDTILTHNPEWIKLLLDWKDAEQADLKEALSACQLQNETNQAALERAGKLSEENFAQGARIRAMVREDVASLRRCVEMQRQRDLLLQAVAELIPFAKSEKLTSHKSFAAAPEMFSTLQAIADNPYLLTPDQWASEARAVLAKAQSE